MLVHERADVRAVRTRCERVGEGGLLSKRQCVVVQSDTLCQRLLHLFLYEVSCVGAIQSLLGRLAQCLGSNEGTIGQVLEEFVLCHQCPGRDTNRRAEVALKRVLDFIGLVAGFENRFTSHEGVLRSVE